MLAGLVVLHDPARAERILVDAVDLSGQRQPVAEIEPSLQLGRRTLAAEEHLETPRHERELRLALRADDGLEVAPQRRVELPRLHLRHVHAYALQRLLEAGAHQAHRIVENAFVELLDAELLRHPREELVERVVRDGAAQLRVHLRVDRARTEEALDEPGRRAVGEPLELGHVERRLRPSCSSTSGCVSRVGRSNALSARSSRRSHALARASASAPSPVARCELRQRTQPLAIGGRVVERPRQRRQRPPPRPHAGRRPDRTPSALRPRTGSARAGCRRRLPPRARDKAARAGACRRCRRGSGRD